MRRGAIDYVPSRQFHGNSSRKRLSSVLLPYAPYGEIIKLNKAQRNSCGAQAPYHWRMRSKGGDNIS